MKPRKRLGNEKVKKVKPITFIKGWRHWIPDKVGRDKKLNPTSKLLFAYIQSLTRQKEFCWASNARLAETINVSVKAITRSIRQLRECGYVYTKIKYINRRGKIECQRKILITRKGRM